MTADPPASQDDQPDATPTNEGRSASAPVEGGDDTAAPEAGSPVA